MDETNIQNTQYWAELLKRSAFTMYIGSAEKAGRRFGLSPYKIKQYFSGLRDELREIDEEMKPKTNEDLGKVLADIKAFMTGTTPAPDQPKATVTLDDIFVAVTANSDRIAKLEGK